MVGRSVAPVKGGVGSEVAASRPVVGGGPGRLGLDGQAGRRRGRGVQEEAGVARSRRPLGVEVVHWTVVGSASSLNIYTYIYIQIIRIIF